jgi:hypothetical protein
MAFGMAENLGFMRSSLYRGSLSSARKALEFSQQT